MHILDQQYQISSKKFDPDVWRATFANLQKSANLDYGHVDQPLLPLCIITTNTVFLLPQALSRSKTPAPRGSKNPLLSLTLKLLF